MILIDFKFGNLENCTVDHLVELLSCEVDEKIQREQELDLKVCTLFQAQIHKIEKHNVRNQQDNSKNGSKKTIVNLVWHTVTLLALLFSASVISRI